MIARTSSCFSPLSLLDDVTLEVLNLCTTSCNICYSLLTTPSFSSIVCHKVVQNAGILIGVLHVPSFSCLKGQQLEKALYGLPEKNNWEH